MSLVLHHVQLVLVLLCSSMGGGISIVSDMHALCRGVLAVVQSVLPRWLGGAK